MVYKVKKNAGEDKKDNEFHVDLMKWAAEKQLEHLTFICFPYNHTTCEKQDSLIDLKYYYDMD